MNKDGKIFFILTGLVFGTLISIVGYMPTETIYMGEINLVSGGTIYFANGSIYEVNRFFHADPIILNSEYWLYKREIRLWLFLHLDTQYLLIKVGGD